jgi:cell wall-associated protease
MDRHQRTLLGAALFVLGFGGTAHAASLTLAWDPSPETSVTGYRLWYGTQSGVYFSSIDVGFQTLYQLTGLTDNTTYYFVVQAYTADDVRSEPSHEISAITPAIVYPSPSEPSSISSVMVTPNKAAPQAVGTTVTWTATPSGGVTPYSYRWFLSAGGTTTALTNWTTNNQYSWTPTAANSGYEVSACARSSWNTSTTGEACLSVPFPIVQPSSVTLATNRPAPQAAGTTINWTATAAGGTAPYQYRWWLSNGTTSVPLTGWVYSNSYAWTPTVFDADYVMTIWVRSAGNSVDAPEMSRSAAFPILRKCNNKKC